MKRIFFFLAICAYGSYSFSEKLAVLASDTVKSVTAKDTSVTEIKNPETPGLDKIIKRSGDSIMCTVLNKNLFEIEYCKPQSKTRLKISTANVKEIYFANGKYELIDNAKEKNKKDWTVTSSEAEWKSVVITSDPSDVAGLSEKGQVEAVLEAKKMTTDNETLEKNANAILKKKAFSMKATHVLVTDKKFMHNYGEMPGIKLIGTAYGK
jgi:hypothetical protein